MTEHEIKQIVQQTIREELKEFVELKATLVDMARDYETMRRGGKWIGGLAVALSVIFGIWASIKAIFH